MSWQRLLDFGDTQTPAFERELLAAIRAAQGQLSASMLVEMVRRHGLSSRQVEKVLRDLPQTLEQAIGPTLRRATTGSAAQAVSDLADRGRIVVSMDLVNPLAVASAESQAALRVVQIGQDSRAAIQAIIGVAIREGLPPRDAASLIRQVIGLTERQAQSVANFRRRLAAQSGQLIAQRAAEKYAAKVLRQRAETIARTEIIDALTHGQQATWRAAQTHGLLPPGALQRWVITPDDRLCPSCAQMVGTRALAPIGGMFSTPLGPRRGPTMHPNCRCTVTIDTRSLRLRTTA